MVCGTRSTQTAVLISVEYRETCTCLSSSDDCFEALPTSTVVGEDSYWADLFWGPRMVLARVRYLFLPSLKSLVILPKTSLLFSVTQ